MARRQVDLPRIPTGFWLLRRRVARLLATPPLRPALSPLGLRHTIRKAPTAPGDRNVTAPAAEIVIPTDLIVTAWRSVYPAERMVFLLGRRDGGETRVTSFRDVTGPNRSIAHVRSSPAALAEALLDAEATGAPVAAWLHSHPGRGVAATHPSHIDRRQEDDLRQDFGANLLGMIATEDGVLRLWGRALETGTVRVAWLGRGIQRIGGEEHVFSLALR